MESRFVLQPINDNLNNIAPPRFSLKIDSRGKRKSFRPTPRKVKEPPASKVRRCLFHPGITTRVLNSKNVGSMFNPRTPLPYLEQCFDVQTQIGEGDFGKVFRARWREDNKLYAVKAYKSPNQCVATAVRNYMKISDHPHIVNLVSAWEQDSKLFCHMELGTTSLGDYLEFAQIDEDEMWSLCLDMLLALEHIHGFKMIHLDVKPANIIRFPRVVYKLADFDLLVSMNKEEVKTATDGDGGYMAPEILQGKFTTAADIFSLGVTMLEVATGINIPPSGTLWHELRGKKLPAEALDKAPHSLQSIIQRMMTLKYTKRPSAKALLRDPLLKSLRETRREHNNDPNRSVTPEEDYDPSPRASTPTNEVQMPANVVTPPLGFSKPNLEAIFDKFCPANEDLITPPEVELVEAQLSRCSMSTSSKRLDFSADFN